MTIEYNDDEILIQRLKSGDDKALDYFFKTYYRELFNLSVRLVDDSQAARDIIQDVFANLWEKRQTLHLKKPVKAYLLKAIINRSLNFLRDHARTECYPLTSIRFDVHATLKNDSSTAMESRELQHAIQQVIQSLPPRCKVVFILSREYQMSNTEIARQLEISVKGVEKHITKALKVLRDSLGPLLKNMALLISFMNG